MASIVKAPTKTPAFLLRQAVALLAPTRQERAIVVDLVNTMVYSFDRATSHSVLDALRKKYLVAAQILNFGAIQKQDKTQNLVVYRNAGLGLGAATFANITAPVATIPETLKIAVHNYRTVQVRYSASNAPAFYFEIVTVGGKFAITARAGLYLRAFQTAKISTTYKFKTAIQDAIDGTEVRTPLLDAPYSIDNYEITVAIPDLTPAMSFLKTLGNNSLMLPTGEPFIVRTDPLAQTITTSAPLVVADTITIEKVGKAENEILHIDSIQAPGVYTYTTNRTTASVTTETGRAQLMVAHTIRSIDAVENTGEVCKIRIATTPTT